MNDYNTLIDSAPLVLVEFFATWCPHCRHMMPIVADLKELLGTEVPIYQLDIDKNSDTASEAGVESIPTFIIYRGGEPVWSHSGEISGDELMAEVRRFM